MSTSVNKAIIIGNVGNDPVIKQTEKCMIANINVATSDYMTKETTWHKIVFFGKSAELVSQYVKKGNLIYLEGKIQNRKYIDKNDQERYISEIIASNFSILTSPRTEQSVNNETFKQQSLNNEVARQQFGNKQEAVPFKDDEIPF